MLDQTIDSVPAVSLSFPAGCAEKQRKFPPLSRVNGDAPASRPFASTIGPPRPRESRSSCHEVPTSNPGDQHPQSPASVQSRQRNIAEAILNDRSGGSEVYIAGRNSTRRVAASRLPNAKLLDGDGGNLFWIANTRPADLNYLLGNGFSERVTAINQIKRAQGQLVGQVQALHIFRPQFRIREKSPDRHLSLSHSLSPVRAVTCENEGLSWSASFRGDLLGGTLWDWTAVLA